jgi:hypothetical protein
MMQSLFVIPRNYALADLTWQAVSRYASKPVGLGQPVEPRLQAGRTTTQWLLNEGADPGRIHSIKDLASSRQERSSQAENRGDREPVAA